jgi:hypothetical protein
MNIKNKPLKFDRTGALSLSLWENENKKSFSFQKSYKEENSEEWKHTTVLNLFDLPKLKVLIEEAYKEEILK